MNSRGEGRAGCLFVLLLTVAFVWVCIQVIPVYIAKIDFEEDLGRIVARAGADGWDNEYLLEQVEEAARLRGFQLDEERTRVERTSPFSARPRIKIDVVYRTTAEFPFYTHEFTFEASATSIVGRL